MWRSTLALLFWAASLPAQVVISQVYGGGGNTGAAFRNDFIELFNSGGVPADLTGWTVQYGPAAMDTWQSTPLSGAISPGRYYLIQQAQGAGGTVSLPVPDATGVIAMSATAAKVALVRNAEAPSPSTLADLVGYGNANLAEGAPTAALTNTTAALRRNGGCQDTGNNAADFQSGAPNPRNSASPPNDCAAPPPPVTAAAISAIQGAAAMSPLAGQTVSVTGIVTARRRNGFYIQTPDAEADTDPATSEGVFVFTSSAPPAEAAAGNRVTVAGTVTEFRPAADTASPTLTELTSPAVTLLSTGNALPAPVTLTAGTYDWERYEGMRVHVARLTAVSPTGADAAFFGILSGPRPFREPGIPLPDPLPAGAPSGIPRFDGNPERLRVDSDEQPGAAPLVVTSGALVTGITGPLDYSFRTYTILPDPGVPPAVSNLAPASPAPPPASGEFTVASFNMQRFLGDSTPAFQTRLSKASLAIRNVLRAPDILGVQEVDTLATLQTLASRLAADGVPYRAYLEEGNDPGGIDVGFLVKPSITVLGVTQEGKQEAFNDRPPLVLRATIGPAAVPLTVIVNHLRSLIDIEDVRVQAKRRDQAEFLARLIQARQAAGPGENIVSIGDYNAFQFNDGYVDLIGTITGAPAPAGRVLLPSPSLVTPALVNLADILPPSQNYSYVFDGSTQTLDHVLVNRNLLGRLSRFVYTRSNADFPEAWRSDPNRPERLSDHDMPVAYFTLSTGLPRITAAGITNTATLLSGAVAPGEIVTIFGAGIGPDLLTTLQLTDDRLFLTKTLGGVRVLFDGLPSPLVYVVSRQVSAVVPYAVAARASTEVQIDFQGRMTNRVTAPVAPAVPGIFPGAVLNQDYSVNSPANPAPAGSIVILYATGDGALSPPSQDGQVTGAALARPVLPVTARIGGQDAEVLYAGTAPGLVAGVLQVNVQVPAAAAAGSAVPLSIAVGAAPSPPGTTLAVR